MHEAGVMSDEEAPPRSYKLLPHTNPATLKDSLAEERVVAE